MFGSVTIGDKSINLKANAVTAVRYKQIFQEDLLDLLLSGVKGGKGVETTQRMCFVMAMQADDADFTKVNEEKYIEWLENFDQLELIGAQDQVMKIYNGNAHTLSKPKKKAGQQKED